MSERTKRDTRAGLLAIAALAAALGGIAPGLRAEPAEFLPVRHFA